MTPPIGDEATLVGETTESPAAEGAGRSVGPYVLVSLLGSGGMGAVWRARTKDGSEVALKLVHAAFRSQAVAERFAREASVRIEHPNVIRVLDAGADADGTPYIAFELLDGESLEAQLDRGTLTPAAARDVGVQLCAGLGAAHARGIVHRDLKPANVIVTPEGTAKVLDFGIALDESRATRLTSTGGILGTPAYLAPEQAQGRLDIDARADVWALGTLLYAALAGRPPFQRETPLATILAIVREDLVPLAVASPTSPPALTAIVERALQKEVARRFATIGEMEAALRAADLSAAASSATLPGHAIEGAGVGRMSLLPEGEQRVVAVLLADGVTRSGTLERAVVERGGVLVPLVGGRAVGIFGGERWEGDEARRAVEAALAARDAATRVAVASGRAMLRGGAISGSVLRAAEAGCAADVRGVAVDAETMRSVGARFVSLSAADGIVEVVAIAGGDADAAGERGTPTLGREAELAQVRQALDTSIADARAVAVIVSGPLGIGKSRLRSHVDQMLAASEAGFLVLSARAEPRRRDVALALCAQIVGGHARRDGGDGPAPRETVADFAPISGTEQTGLSLVDDRAGALVSLVREACDDDVEERAAFLGELVGVPMPGHSAVRIARGDAQLMADRLRITVADWLCGLAARGPLALVLEDLQWADAASLELLTDVLDQLAGTTFVVFAATRPELLEARPELWRAGDHVRITPRGLSARDVATLASDVAGEPLADALVRAVADRTGGNPLFVEQVVTALREDGLLGVTSGELPLPVTVEAAIQSRLDHLPAAEKDLCKRAAVYGRPFTTDELSALGVLDATELLASLARRELILTRDRRAARASPSEPSRSVSAREAGREHSFRSALVGEVAYRLVTDDARTDLHRRAAAHLSLSGSSDPEEIASHHARGDEPAPAAARYAEAALAAARRGDGATVVRCSEQALAFGPPPAVLYALHGARADALGFLGRFDAQAVSLDAALAAATTPAERADTRGKSAALASRTGRMPEAVTLAADAVRDAREAADADVLARALAQQGFVLVRSGQLADARPVLDEATERAATCGALTRAIVADKRAELAGASGELDARRREYSAAATMFGECGDLRRRAGAEANLADVYNRFGAYAEAERALRIAVDGCRRVGYRIMEGYALANLAYSLVHLGRTDEALAALDEAAQLAGDGKEVQLALVVRLYRARTLLDGAAAEAAASDAEKSGNRAVRALSLAAAARAALAEEEAGVGPEALRSSRRERAVALAAEAVAITESLGGIEEDEAEIYLTLARALEAHGADATRVRADGRRRVAAIAAGISDEEWRRRFLRDVVANRELCN